MKLQSFTTEVESSMLKSLTVIPSEELLIAEFNGGAKYLYVGVPSQLVSDIMNAESQGKAFNKEIKNGGFNYHKI